MILLTGATGFLGSEILNALVLKNEQVLITKRSSSNLHRIQKHLNNLQVVDIDEISVQEIFNKYPIETVVHAATSYGRKGENILQLYDSNLNFPMEIAYYGSRQKLRTFINTSTSLPENLNLYSRSKKHWEQLIKGSFPELQVINMIPEYFYGPGDDDTKFVTMLCNKMLTKEPVIELSQCIQERDFFYVDDLVNAYLIVLQDKERLPQVSDFSVGSGQAYKLKEVVLKLAHLTSYDPANLKFGAKKLRINEVMYSKADIEKLMNLNWLPKVPLDEGLKKTIYNTRYGI